MNLNYLGIFNKSVTAVWTQGFDLQGGKELDLGALTGDHLDTHLDLKRKDEVGVLARTFEDLVDRLAEVRK